MSPPQPAHCLTTAAAVPLAVPELLVTGFDPGSPGSGRVDDGADTAVTGYADPADD